MLTTLRAGLSLALLVGLYVYLLGIIVGMLGLSLVMIVLFDSHPYLVALGGLVVAGLLGAGSVLWFAWQISRRGRSVPGVALTPSHAPRLWAMVRELAEAVGTRSPDEIRLVSKPDATVIEYCRLVGLVGGRRYLFIGLPLVQAFTVAQLRAGIAHVLGHYARRQVRLAAPVYRARVMFTELLTRPGARKGLTHWLVRPYAYLYFRVSAAVCRAQEIEADRASVRLAGHEAAISTLRELSGVGDAWNYYLGVYVTAGLPVTNLAPADPLGHFPTMLAARAEEMAALHAEPLATSTSRWDPHPPAAQRAAWMARETATPVIADTRPATALVSLLDTVAEELAAQVLGFGRRTRVPFPQYVTATVEASEQQRADRLYRSLGRVPGAGSPSLATVLGLLAAGRASELAAALTTASVPQREAAQLLRDALAGAIAVAATSSGVADWQHSWSSPPLLVAADGERIDYRQLAARALRGEDEAVRAELATRGIELSATATQSIVDLGRARPMAGLIATRVNRERYDVAVFDLGLLLLPALTTRRPRPARERMRTILPAPTSALADIPGARFVPYEEVTEARIVRRFYVRRELQLHSGERLVIKPATNLPQVAAWQTLDRAVKLLTPNTGRTASS